MKIEISFEQYFVISKALFTLETRSRGGNQPRATAYSWENQL